LPLHLWKQMNNALVLTLCVSAFLLTRASQAQDAAPAQPPTLDWRLRFEVGQTVRVRREIYRSGAVNSGGQRMVLKNSLALIYSLQVLEVEPDGTARARLKLLTFGFKGDGGRTFYSPFPGIVQQSADEVLEPYRLAAKSSLELSIGPRGEVDWAGENFEAHKDEKRHQARARRGPNALNEIAAEQTLYSLAEDLRLLLAYLPQEPVEAGRKWSRSIGAHPTRPTQAHQLDSTLLEVGPASATLQISEHLLAHPQFSGTVESDSTGRLQLDVADGWPRRAEMDKHSRQKPDGEPISTSGKSHTAYTFTLSEPS